MHNSKVHGPLWNSSRRIGVSDPEIVMQVRGRTGSFASSGGAPSSRVDPAPIRQQRWYGRFAGLRYMSGKLLFDGDMAFTLLHQGRG